MARNKINKAIKKKDNAHSSQTTEPTLDIQAAESKFNGQHSVNTGSPLDTLVNIGEWSQTKTRDNNNNY